MRRTAIALFIGGGLAVSISAADWKAPRTPWGEPDISGTWTSQSELGIPFERPASFGTRALLTDEEFKQREEQAQRQLQSDNADFNQETADTSNAGQVGSATSPPPTWLERGRASRRASLVIDPPDGRLPPTSAAGVARQRAAGLGALDNGPFDGPENMGLYQRCITRGTPGAMFPAVYNANTRIVQGPGYVAITYEMIHETRIVPTTPRPHLKPHMRQFLGDAVGHWEGDTFVVDTTNFNSRVDYRGSGAGMHLVERFRRTQDGGLHYEVTVEDPDTWARPWTAALEMRPQTAGMFEYACHEGNYAMKNMLTASRAVDRK